ncbi:APC family permease [Candidatus Woesearchaeota archaeon]|nr:APC family permease [Candidatus Woesearchaeota archaeon]
MLKLKREVGLFGATMYILGVIIGAGIYVIIGKAAGITGSSLWFAFLLAAVIAACTGLSYAELASAFPYDSAEYYYTARAFKDRRFSFGIGWLKLITHVIGTSAVALGFGGYLARLTGWNFIFCALLLIAVLAVINLVGVKQAVSFDILMVIVAIVGLLIVLAFGASSIHSFDFYTEAPAGFSGIMTAAALVFFAFLGFENVGNISEEVKDPKKTLPKALIISVIVSTLLYVLVAVVAVSVVPWQELGQSTSPLSDVMTTLMGTKAGIMMAIMALAATGSTVLGLLIGTSRMVYGMAEERTMPQIFLKVSRKRRVPYVAILSVALVCALFVLPGDITSVAFLTDFGALFIFLVINLCLIVLRYTHHNAPRTFRVPVNIGRFPVIPAVGMLSCAGLLFSFEKKVFLIGILMFLFGILLYATFGERKHKEHLDRKIHGDAPVPSPKSIQKRPAAKMIHKAVSAPRAKGGAAKAKKAAARAKAGKKK